jgi:hypothetical protein
MSKAQIRGIRDFFSQAVVYYSVVVFSVCCSVGWFLYALHVSCKDDASRGGAVTVIVSLFLLFLRRNYGERVYRSVLDGQPALAKKIKDVSEEKPLIPFTNEEASWLLLGIVGWVNTDSDAQENQNRALFLSSAFGTAVWGFGDVFYKWVKCHCLS